jgi:diacylglycerol kinase family enzyme
MVVRQQARRAVVVHSPHSGASEQLKQALLGLQQAGVALSQVISITELAHCPAQGAIWQQQDIDLVIGAGGDGLIGGILTHIADSDLPLGILPLGTSNDVARSLAIPQDVVQAVEVIVRGHEHAVDVGVALPAEQAPQNVAASLPPPLAHGVVNFFAHALTIGINASFAHVATQVAVRERYGPLTYPVAALETLKSLQALEVQLHFEEVSLPPSRHAGQATASSFSQEALNTLQCRALLVAVINAPIFGGGWQFTFPHVRMDDGLLDIVIIQDFDMAALSSTLASWLFGSSESSPSALPHPAQAHPADLIPLPGIAHIQARSVTIATTADPQEATCDGEMRGQTPLHVQTAKKRVRVLVP